MTTRRKGRPVNTIMHEACPTHLHIAGVGCGAVTRFRGDRRAAHQLIKGSSNRLGEAADGRDDWTRLGSRGLKSNSARQDTFQLQWFNRVGRTYGSTRADAWFSHATAMISPHSSVRTLASAHSHSLGAPETAYTQPHTE